MQQHRLNMLASAQAIDAEIDARAGKRARRKVANLHEITQTTGRPDPEIREYLFLRIDILDSWLFLYRTPPSSSDLILVRRPPVMKRRSFA
jgi:hypothetical protein